MHHAVAAAGYGQAASVSGAVWQWVSLSKMRICAGAAAEVCEAARGFLSGVQGALRQYGTVYGERGGWAGVLPGVGDLCALFEH